MPVADPATVAQLAQAVQPLTLARQRLLPVHPVVAPIVPTGGLVRGSTVSCTGEAAMSLALVLAGGITQAGSWAGVVGLPSVGLAAAAELGVVLRRTVFVAAPPPSQWATVLATLVDGTDVVVAGLPLSARVGEARRLQARLQARQAVLVVVGDPGPLSVDLAFDTTAGSWEGVGEGHGHLVRRRVTIEVSGRRSGRPRRSTVWLPGASGAPEAIDEPAGAPAARSRRG
jgi:hypothetical protein